MWPLVAWLLLYPLSLPAADYLTHLSGRERGDVPPWAAKASLALYFAAAAILAVRGFLP